MTKERIIIDHKILKESASNAADFKAFWIILKAKAEPAPDPKFRPVCFYNWSEPLGTCQMSELESFVADHPQCKICPHGAFMRTKAGGA